MSMNPITIVGLLIVAGSLVAAGVALWRMLDAMEKALKGVADEAQRIVDAHLKDGEE